MFKLPPKGFPAATISGGGRSDGLPSEVRESLVCFSHLVSILTLLSCCTAAVDSIKNFVCKAFLHCSLAAETGILCKPAQTESFTSFGANLDRNLICCTTDTASLNLEQRHNVFHCCFKNLKRFFAGLLTDNFKSTVNDFLCNTLLTVEHDVVDKTCYNLRIVNWIWQNVAFCY